MIEVFKTDVHEQQQAIGLAAVLSFHFPICKINFDLEDCDRILRIEGDYIAAHKVVSLLNERGHECTVLE